MVRVIFCCLKCIPMACRQNMYDVRREQSMWDLVPHLYKRARSTQRRCFNLVWSCHFYRLRWFRLCVWEGEGGESQRERGCVRIHMPIELVCSDGEGGGGDPQALPIWCWRFYYSCRDVMAKGGGRRWGVWIGDGGGYNGSRGKGKSILRFFSPPSPTKANEAMFLLTNK